MWSKQSDCLVSPLWLGTRVPALPCAPLRPCFWAVSLAFTTEVGGCHEDEAPGSSPVSIYSAWKHLGTCKLLLLECSVNFLQRAFRPGSPTMDPWCVALQKHSQAMDPLKSSGNCHFLQQQLFGKCRLPTAPCWAHWSSDTRPAA